MGTPTTRVLIIGDRLDLRVALAQPLRRAGYDVYETGGWNDALRILRVRSCDVVFASPQARIQHDTAAMVSQITAACNVPIVIFTASGSVAEAVQAIKAGAHDYLQLPVELTGVLRLVNGILGERHAGAGAPLARRPAPGGGREGFIAADVKTRQLFETTRRLAAVDCTVLITGESGTGKEVVARRIFEQSRRRVADFVALNCGAIPESLLESELFGCHKGAFTGATTDRPGLIEEAEGGVLFLDEIGEMSPRFQTTLLRFLDNAELRRVGDNTLRRVNTRIIAATNRRLDDDVRRGSFRADLFYRLSVVSLRVASLRERPDDVIPLAEHFLRRAAAKFQADVRGFSACALALLRRYDWPGNVRQLQNVVEGAVALTTDSLIGPEALPADVRAGSRLAGAPSKEGSELTAIAATLEQCGGNHTRAAAALGISRSTLWRRMRRTPPEGEGIDLDDIGPEPVPDVGGPYEDVLSRATQLRAAGG